MTASPGNSGSKPESPWFEEWFSHPFYLEVYKHRDRDEAALCINTILSVTGLGLKTPETVSILDIACGAGRHAIELARQGYCVTGNDLSPYLLEEARKEAAGCGIILALSCCDMREIPANGDFDMVVQLFTSFGYFDTEEDDLRVLNKVLGTLKPGGWYVLDLINPRHLEKNIQPQTCRSVEGLSVKETRRLDGGRVLKTISITSPDGKNADFIESVRLYNLGTISSMLLKAGFVIEKVAGNYSGEPFEEENSPRMMIFCRKP
ncbi:MAG: class I SAM-dependent methyltransferase [Chlorobiaceae bacterium]|nr:class I SAM-dependent methyltransferase [Chlorobiaceae bacterium]